MIASLSVSLVDMALFVRVVILVPAELDQQSNPFFHPHRVHQPILRRAKISLYLPLGLSRQLRLMQAG